MFELMLWNNFRVNGQINFKYIGAESNEKKWDEFNQNFEQLLAQLKWWTFLKSLHHLICDWCCVWNIGLAFVGRNWRTFEPNWLRHTTRNVLTKLLWACNKGNPIGPLFILFFHFYGFLIKLHEQSLGDTCIGIFFYCNLIYFTCESFMKSQ